ncbi:MJ1255/VC2487 family glycosyltransferase [Ferrimonas balearica]|uniref:MJ1255/VC2487 family glycosyltransferase n=1 Tax=Ferrimonas balearica TaxID=44012 RepID=UPI001C99840C|nr:MJ1255/VC2487 family glycosyltransferase [Ferrimonas balearica]MBY5922571.1 glycosyltransferase [Ferrimonas balearica]MBY5995555.1 glycosyltransferase [Ferrimonas balearica]
MRILYGVQGTGNGHLTRARVIAPAFARAGVEVDYLFSGRPREAFFDMEAFGEFQCKRGLSFSTRKGEISLLGTARDNKLMTLWRDIRQLDLSGYDLVLNDFEPISAWAAKRQGKPCIGISHQNAFNHPVPITGDRWHNRLIMKHFAPTSVALGCHWHHFGCDLLPPFIEAIEPAPTESGKVLVYLPFEEVGDIVNLLRPLTGHRFVIYHGSPAPEALPEHLSWNGFCRQGFQRDLASCCGVICSAGFELVSEALVLGKKLLLKPLQGQFEQLSNALALELLGAAESMKTLCPDRVAHWLDSPAIEPIQYPQMGDTLVTWLLARQWDDVSGLCQQAWAEARLPEAWQHKWAYAY